jgi:hypothetical protein
MKCTPEIRSVAESQRQSDFLVRKFRCAEIFQRDLRSKLIQQSAKGKALLPKLTPQRPFIRTKEPCHGRKARRISDVTQQECAELSGNPNSQFQIVKQVVA